MTVKPKVFVVGSGIIGASVALACQDLGAKVTVLEQGSLGGIASANSFGWITQALPKTRPIFIYEKWHWRVFGLYVTGWCWLIICVGKALFGEKIKGMIFLSGLVA